MDLKYLVVLAVLGVVSGFTIPEDSPESLFPAAYTETNPSSPPAIPAVAEEDGATRTKRHLLFKKYKKGSTFHSYESGVSHVDTRPGREVHHHHYSTYPQPPTYVEHRWEPRPAPSNDYHHYHGYQQGAYAGSGYYSGGYTGGYSNGGSYPRPNYGNGGYSQYGPPPQQAGPVGAAPVGTSHNAVDRGQGAAAVNNIAIIHARAGSSTHHNNADESRILPKPLPMDFDDISRGALGLE